MSLNLKINLPGGYYVQVQDLRTIVFYDQNSNVVGIKTFAQDRQLNANNFTVSASALRGFSYVSLTYASSVVAYAVSSSIVYESPTWVDGNPTSGQANTISVTWNSASAFMAGNSNGSLSFDWTKDVWGAQAASTSSIAGTTNALPGASVVTTSPVSIAVAGIRLGVLRGGTLAVKEGISGGWTTEDSDVSSFKLSPGRIGILKNNKDLLVKDFGLTNKWTPIDNSVDSFQLTDAFIGVLIGKKLKIKAGKLGAPWIVETDNVDAFQIDSSSDIAMMSRGNEVFARRIGLGDWIKIS